MTNAPERIWIEDEFGEGDDDQWTYGTWDVRNYRGYVVEYVRADTVQELTAERDRLGRELNVAKYGVPDFAWSVHLAAMAEVQAERDRLREAIDYILDGMGIADPDYDIDPDDDFLDAANSEWVRDTLTRLAAALKGETP